jgi:hypothetical protein
MTPPWSDPRFQPNRGALAEWTLMECFMQCSQPSTPGARRTSCRRQLSNTQRGHGVKQSKRTDRNLTFDLSYPARLLSTRQGTFMNSKNRHQSIVVAIQTPCRKTTVYANARTTPQMAENKKRKETKSRPVPISVPCPNPSLETFRTPKYQNHPKYSSRAQLDVTRT